MANPKLDAQPALMTKACEDLPVTDHERIVCGLNMASRGLASALAEVVSPHGLNGTEANLIQKLDLGHTSPTEIATWLGIDNSTLSRVARKLEERGIVKREVDEANRSRLQISLTAEGKRTADAIRGDVRKMEEELLSELSRKDIEDFKRVLQKLCISLVERQG